MTRPLLSMAGRLACLGVTRVVMEATSDYWKPVFYLLEAAVPTHLPIFGSAGTVRFREPPLPKARFGHTPGAAKQRGASGAPWQRRRSRYESAAVWPDDLEPQFEDPRRRF
jgi:hypothetical protein